jgi:hypothetical protein
MPLERPERLRKAGQGVRTNSATKTGGNMAKIDRDIYYNFGDALVALVIIGVLLWVFV